LSAGQSFDFMATSFVFRRNNIRVVVNSSSLFGLEVASGGMTCAPLSIFLRVFRFVTGTMSSSVFS
jgi:hypothetical protein